MKHALLAKRRSLPGELPKQQWPQIFVRLLSMIITSKLQVFLRVQTGHELILYTFLTSFTTFKHP
jgi:hypothetical protein